MSTVKPYRKNASDEVLRINVIKQDFSPSCPNCVWASDITYLRVKASTLIFVLLWTCFLEKLFLGSLIFL